MADGKNDHNRQSIFQSKEFAHIRETLTYATQAGYIPDPYYPIRNTPLQAFFSSGKNALKEMEPNPYLDEIWKQAFGIRIGDYATDNVGGQKLQETVAVPNTLSALKIADIIVEGAEPWSDWKQYAHLISMDTPKVNVPRTRYTDNVGGGSSDSIDIFKEAGGKGTPLQGGQAEPIELDCSGTKNSYRTTVQVLRNDVKDNNFLAVEQALKNAGNNIYYLVGKKIISTINTNTGTNTDTRANLDLGTSVHSEFEALSNVIRSIFPGTQRNTADTMFIHPADAYQAIATSTGASGTYPFLSRFILGPTDDKDVVNNSGLAGALGLKNVWETPQQTSGTVTITKRDVSHIVGLREDLTLENYDQTVGGLYNTDLVMRFDVQEGYEDGSYKITSF